jgi:hypothetical protein
VSASAGIWFQRPRHQSSRTLRQSCRTKVLDEYFPSWTPQIAEGFFSAIGPEGRAAYRRFYLIMDFWFPGAIASLTTASLMLIAFPPNLRVGLALRHRGAGLAVRRRRERHAFSNGWQLPKPVVDCPQVWTAVDPREVRIRDRAPADCAGWARLSVPSRTLMARLVVNRRPLWTPTAAERR